MVPMQTEPLFVRVHEASRLLGVPRSTLYREVQRGSIPSRKIGGAVIIPKWFVVEGGEPDGGHTTRSTQR